MGLGIELELGLGISLLGVVLRVRVIGLRVHG